MTQDLALLSATALMEGYRTRRFSPSEVVEACLARIAKFGPSLNAFVFVDGEGARKAAADSTARWAAGRPIGRVDGVPTTIKDILLSQGWPTLRGSKTVDAAQPWTEDAPCVARLREEGAIFLGKTTTPEFGWKGVTDSPLTGITRNPWDVSKTPGGSSGGASAACAAGFGALHLGTDGGGSIRIPAAFAGIVGLKPTYGRVPAHPLSPFGTVAHVGPMTRTVADTALMLSVIARPDVRDWYALPHDDTDYLARLIKAQGAKPLAGKRLAFAPSLSGYLCAPAVLERVKAAADLFRDLGATVEEVIPEIPDTTTIFTLLWFAGAANVYRALGEEQKALLDPGFRDVAEQGSKIALLDYLAAVKAREAVGVAMAKFHETYDLLLLPSLPLTAFEAGIERPAGMERWTTWTPYSYPFNLTQQPAISVPCGLVEGLPVGLQIVGPKYRDDRVLVAAESYERLIGGFPLPKL